MSGADRRDPFEAAADEAFHAPTPAPASEAAEPAREGRSTSEAASPEAFGRDGAPAADADEDRPNDPTSFDAEAAMDAPRPGASGEPMVAARQPTQSPDGKDPEGDAFDADPTGERFRSGAFSNEPGWLQPGPKNAQLCYWVNLSGFVYWPLALVSVGMAIFNRPKVGPELGSHYTYALRTVLLVVLYTLLASVMGRVSGIALLAVVVWFAYRNLRGLARVGSGSPIPDPKAWLT